MSNCNPHLFGGDHHCGSCGRSAEDIVAELEAEIVDAKTAIKYYRLIDILINGLKESPNGWKTLREWDKARGAE